MDLMHLLSRLFLFAGLIVTAASAQGPENWQVATDLPNVDLSGLSATQKTAVLKILREQGCSCGCGMKMAECRVKDPGCTFSSGLAAIVVKGVREEKTRDQILAALKDSALAKGPAPRPILSDPVKVPINGAPAKGPENARVALIE